jgi:hypothetical protein
LNGQSINGHVDGGQDEYYAGPKYIYAPHECIAWGGGATRPGSSDTQFWISPASHCG